MCSQEGSRRSGHGPHRPCCERSELFLGIAASNDPCPHLGPFERRALNSWLDMWWSREAFVVRQVDDVIREAEEARMGEKVRCVTCGAKFETDFELLDHQRATHAGECPQDGCTRPRRHTGRHGSATPSATRKAFVPPPPEPPKPVSPTPPVVVTNGHAPDLAEAAADLLRIVEKAAVAGIATDPSEVDRARWRLGYALASHNPRFPSERSE